jgi:hypothetical protein
MDNALFFFALVPVASFAAGVIFHKYVTNHTEKLKEHVTAEVQEVRADIASLVAKISSKL